MFSAEDSAALLNSANVRAQLSASTNKYTVIETNTKAVVTTVAPNSDSPDNDSDRFYQNYRIWM